MPEGAADVGDQSHPLRIIRKQAEAGDASAQARLGRICETGAKGVAQDFNEALRWYRLAADQGDAEAQWNLGRLYSEGRGIAQDLVGAAKWYREAALRGHAQAQYKLGNLYRTGTGVPADHGQAVRWYQEGANRGEVLAQNNLGLMLKNGYGADQDKVRAYMWLHLAALSYLGAGDEERYTNVIGSRNQLAADMTPEEIAAALRLAEEWRPNYQQKGPPAELATPSGDLTLGDAEVRDSFAGEETVEAVEPERPAKGRKPNYERKGSATGSVTQKGELTMGDGKGRDIPEDDEQGLPVMTKLAILCVALGPEGAGEVLKPLGEHEVEEITQAITNLKNVPLALQDKVLAEFEQQMLAGNWGSQGGVEFARQALERAKGPQKAQEILDRVTHTVSSGFHLLKNVAPDQIAPFISHEHPQTIALILSQLDSTQAAGILSLLPERLQTDVAYRIATMENITPAVLKQIEESLEVSLRSILGGNKDVGGAKVAADILNLTGISVEKHVLGQMDAQDPEVTESVRNLMFTFTDIVRLSGSSTKFVYTGCSPFAVS